MTSQRVDSYPEYTEKAPSIEDVNALCGNALLEFGAPWCGHCQAAERIAKDVLAEFSTLPHIRIYDGKGKRLGRAFRVKLWPTFILLRDGKELARIVRPGSASEMRELMRNLDK